MGLLVELILTYRHESDGPKPVAFCDWRVVLIFGLRSYLKTGKCPLFALSEHRQAAYPCPHRDRPCHARIHVGDCLPWAEIN
jgi:hypothetical protein